MRTTTSQDHSVSAPDAVAARSERLGDVAEAMHLAHDARQQSAIDAANGRWASFWTTADADADSA